MKENSKSKKRVVIWILLAAVALFLVIMITYPYPVSPSPDYDAATYEEFTKRLSSAEQEYLVPDSACLQVEGSDVLYRIFLKDRKSYDSEGYVCYVRDVNDHDIQIVYIGATPDAPSDIDLEEVQHTSEDQTEILFQHQTECLAVQFQYGGLYYLIKTYAGAPCDALAIARAMIQSGTI